MIKPVILLTFANEEKRFLSKLKEESDIINKHLMNYKKQGFIEVERDESATINNLSFYLQQYHNRVSIFHFAGHAETWHLIFEDGKSHSSGLGGLLAVQKELILVFLNGCGTKKQSELLLKKGVKAVIATTLPIEDGQAKDFADLFYSGLCAKQSIGEALNHAVNHFKLKYKSYHEIEQEPIAYYRSLDLRSDGHGKQLPWQLLINEKAADEVLRWKIPVPEQFSFYPHEPKSGIQFGQKKFFLLYAEEDKTQVEKLKKFLHLMQNNGEIELIDMNEIDFGRDREKEITKNIYASDYILCMITYNFLFTAYGWAEKARAMQKMIIPILINVVGLDDTFFPKLKMLPSNKKAIAEWQNEDAAYTDVVQQLRQAVKS